MNVLPGPLPLPIWLLSASLTVLALVPAERGAAADWADVRRSGVFVCRADFSLRDDAELVEELARLEHDVRETLDLPAPRETIELYLFRSQASYRAHLKRHHPGVPDRRALYVKGHGPGKVFVYRHRDMAIDVRHEGTHALLHAVLPMVPLWLDEGLAEYFEVPSDERAYDHAHLAATRWHLRLGRPPRLDRLEACHELDELTGGDYRQAWAWVHFMLHGPEAAGDELRAYLADLERRTPPGTFSRRLTGQVPNADARLAEHFRSWKR